MRFGNSYRKAHADTAKPGFNGICKYQNPTYDFNSYGRETWGQKGKKRGQEEHSRDIRQEDARAALRLARFERALEILGHAANNGLAGEAGGANIRECARLLSGKKSPPITPGEAFALSHVRNKAAIAAFRLAKEEGAVYNDIVLGEILGAIKAKANGKKPESGRQMIILEAWERECPLDGREKERFEASLAGQPSDKQFNPAR